MRIITNPKVILSANDRELFYKLDEFIRVFDDDFCLNANCDNCPHREACDSAFAEDRPYEEIRRAVAFLQSLPYEED